MTPFAHELSLRRAGIGVLALLLLSGCGDRGVVARVGTQTITTEDFEAAAQVLAGRYGGPPDSAKLALLNDLVEREILIQGALREGLHRDTTFLDQRRRIEEQLMRQRLFEDLGGTSVPVSDAEVAALYAWRGRESRARVIVSMNENAIRAAHAEVRRGADFAQVAQRYNTGGVAPPGGDLGWVVPGSLQGPLDDAIRVTEPGRLVGPVEVPGQYWFLAKVEQRRARQQPPLEAEREMLFQTLQQRKQRELLVRALNHMDLAYDVRLEPGAGQELIARIQPFVIRGQSPPEPTPAEGAQVLVRYRGGAYTLGDAYQDLLIGQSQRPNFQVLPTVERWLELRALERAALEEARRRRYQDEPPLRRAVRERSNDYLLEGYVARQVLAVAQPTDADLRVLLARLTGGMPRLSNARFLWVALRDSAAALALASRAPQAGGLREAVAAAGLGDPVRSENASYPTQHPVWGSLEPILLGLEEGGYAGPLRLPDGWLLVQLISKTAAPLQIEGLPDEMRAELEHQAVEVARANRLSAVTDSLRRMIPVQTHPERLRRIAWPAPAPAGSPPPG